MLAMCVYIYIFVNTKHITLTKEIKGDITWKAF